MAESVERIGAWTGRPLVGAELVILHAAEDTQYAQLLVDDFRTRGLMARLVGPDSNRNFVRLVRWSRQLVVLASTNSAQPAVGKRIATFLELFQERPRPLQVIDVNEALQSCPWQQLAFGIEPIRESEASAGPTANTLNRLTDAARYARTRSRDARLVAVAMLLTLGSWGVTLILGDRAADLSQRAHDANELAAKANEAQRSASARAAEADRRRKDAEADATRASKEAEELTAQAQRREASVPRILETLRIRSSTGPENDVTSFKAVERRTTDGAFPFRYEVTPSFDKALRADDIDLAIYHARGLCGGQQIQASTKAEGFTFGYEGVACYVNLFVLFLLKDGSSVSARTTACPAGPARTLVCK